MFVIGSFLLLTQNRSVQKGVADDPSEHSLTIVDDLGIIVDVLGITAISE
jgi:hypothetical protein